MTRLTRRFFLATTALATSSCATLGSKPSADFAIENDGQKLTVLDGDNPVLAFNTAPVPPPAGVDAQRFTRSGYIHPLYSPGGAIVTEDFPKDHYHHRGVFWAWPNCHVNGRKLNVWELDTGRAVFDAWMETSVRDDTVRLQEHSLWKFDDDGSAPIDEQVTMIVHPAKQRQRPIDFELMFKNIAGSDVSFQGSAASAGAAGAGAKGYGGFCFRPDANNKPFAFTAQDGVIPEDRMAHQTPWADISWGTTDKRGVAIVQHPSNPGYPHPGWIIRHYGFLGASWPHNDPYTLKPGESFTLRYRLIVHEGDAVSAGIAEAAKAFAAGG